jgi:hypothetical protein
MAIFWSIIRKSEMEEIKKDYKPKARSGLIVKNIGDEKVLFNPDDSTIHILNRTAFPIWEMSDGSNSVDTIIKRLAAMFKDSEKFDIDKDVYHVISEFKEKGIIE